MSVKELQPLVTVCKSNLNQMELNITQLDNE